MPAATRIGDADVPHCSGMVRAEGSANVFVNNKDFWPNKWIEIS